MTLTTPPAGLVPEDYERIEAAVMETARGRWFLMEFARRQHAAETAGMTPPLPAAQEAQPRPDPRLIALSRLDRLSLESKIALFG
jgi:hypothetical protein